MESYKQLTLEQRYQIYALLKTGNTTRKTADIVGVDKSTIGRELKRNSGLRGYRPKQAHKMAMERRKKSTSRITSETWVMIEALIRNDWSPEQISGRLKREHEIHISHEWIYQYIYTDKHSGGDLYRHLRCRKKNRKRCGSHDRRGKIPNRISIEQRPESINDRLRAGDWEVDTLFGAGRTHVLVTLTERKSRMGLVGSVTRKTAQAVSDEIISLLTPLTDRTHSITSDNGKEFSYHQNISRQLNIDFYFANPYAAWERGSNENMNGLLRQYFPKKCDLTELTSEEIHSVMHKLNNRPRKCLDFKTPIEVFFNQPVALTS